MQILLIGMSGIGKSHWSKNLTQRGFRVFDCDEEIARHLDTRLTGEGDAIERLAAWLGFPYQDGYAEREEEYLALENEVTKEALHLVLEAEEHDEELVVDTTGSVIYVQTKLLAELREAMITVHLAAPESVQERMCREYLEYPRPILWRDHFSEEGAENSEQAIRNSYPKLLAAREQQYRKLADVTFEPDRLRAKHFGVDRFLGRIDMEMQRIRSGAER